jgi:hypothetical protein
MVSASPEELKLARINHIDEANRLIRDVYVPAHNARFARPAALPESAFVPIADPMLLREVLCVQEERIVARDNTVSFRRLKLQLPQSPLRHHYVKARVIVRVIGNFKSYRHFVDPTMSNALTFKGRPPRTYRR